MDPCCRLFSLKWLEVTTEAELSQPGFFFLFSCRRQGAGFSASSAIQPPWHANYFHCLSSWASQPPQLIALLSISKIVFDFKGGNEWISIGAFLLLSFLRELAGSVGGKTCGSRDFLGPSECWGSNSASHKQAPTGQSGLPDFRSKIWSFWHNSMKPVIRFANSTTYWMAWVIWMAHCCHRASLDWSRGHRPWTHLLQGADEMCMPLPTCYCHPMWEIKWFCFPFSLELCEYQMWIW